VLPGALERHRRIGIAMQHQRRHGDRLQVLAEVGGAERLRAAERGALLALLA